MPTTNEPIMPFDLGAIRQPAMDGVCMEDIATMMGVSLKKLKAKERKVFEDEFAKCLAMGVADVMGGLTRAAKGGDTKAAEMYMRLVGVTPHSTETPGTAPRRLLVEVTTVDD